MCFRFELGWLCYLLFTCSLSFIHPFIEAVGSFTHASLMICGFLGSKAIVSGADVVGLCFYLFLGSLLVWLFDGFDM